MATYSKYSVLYNMLAFVFAITSSEHTVISLWYASALSVFVQAALCSALQLRDTQKEKSPLSHAVEHKWMSTKLAIFHLGLSLSPLFLPTSLLLSKEELKVIFA